MSNKKHIYKSAEKGVVFLGLIKRQNSAINIIGSGFLVKNSTGEIKIVSAAHVFNQMKEGLVSEVGSNAFVGVFKWKDAENTTEFDLHDFSLEGNNVILDEGNDIGMAWMPVEHQTKNYVPYELDQIEAWKPYEEWTNTVSVGFPLTNEFLILGVWITLFISSSIIASVKNNSSKKDIDFMLTDNHINPGSSGSPLFDEENKKIIGVVSGTFNNNFVSPVKSESSVNTVQIPRNIGLIRPSYYLAKLLNRA